MLYREQKGFVGIVEQSGDQHPWITEDGVRYCVGVEYTYRLNTNALPRQIDRMSTNREGPTQISKGIYKLEGDKL